MTPHVVPSAATGQVVLDVGRARLALDPAAGGRIASWTVDGMELLRRQTPSLGPEQWGCYPMVPWAGRVRDGRFRWDGREVRLPRPAGPHALHGVGHRLAWTVIEQGPDRVVLTLDLPTSSDPTGWPFGGRVEQAIVLGADAVELTMRTTAATAMPLTVGWHPWFVRHLGGASAVVDLQAGRMLVRDDDGLPTHRWSTPSPGPWDDCVTDLVAPPEVTWPGVGSVVVASDLTHAVVFDQHPEGVCVEPQSGPPDEVNGPAPRVLAAGETFTCRMTLGWASAPVVSGS